MLLLILILTIVYFVFFNGKNKNLKHMSKPITVKCNESDVNCRMYNVRDIQSKCQSLCVQENHDYVFTGNHKQKDDEHICECNYPNIEKFTLDFTNVGENPDILPDIIPTDMKFSDRNYLEKVKEERYKDLIFGNSN